MKRRPLLLVAGVILAAYGTANAVEPAPDRPAAGLTAPNSTPLVAAVVGVTIPVSDLDQAVAFYRDVLSFEKTAEREEAGGEVERIEGLFGVRRRVATMRLGAEEIELTQYLAPEGRAVPADSRSNDAWFQHIAIVVRDLDAAYAHLRLHRVRHASSGPQVLPLSNPNAGGIGAFYFKDPDGHVLEVIHFPAGKGDPKWQSGTGLFLGIDHTAIVVRDTEAALGFYRDRLGLRVAGASENFGIEQERLNNVFGARLRITALRAERGPGVELLEYLAPRTGRTAPTDTKASDLWAWQTRVEVYNASLLEPAARLTRSTWVSPGVVGNDPAGGGVPAGVQCTDMDGHRVLITAPVRER
ncbi:MAG TPA: VOC family protein [Phycisphaerales bacterium]